MASRLPGVPRSLIPRVFAVLLSCVLLLATLFAGRTYSWCSLTHQVCTIACLEDGCDDTHVGEEGPALHEPCCEARALGALPPGAHRDGLPGIPDAKVAVLPSLPRLLPAVRRLDHRALLPTRVFLKAAPPRAGPLAAGDRCTVLQVFRC